MVSADGAPEACSATSACVILAPKFNSRRKRRACQDCDGACAEAGNRPRRGSRRVLMLLYRASRWMAAGSFVPCCLAVYN